MEPNYGIVRIFHTPMSVVGMIMIPFIAYSQKIGNWITVAGVYVAYVIFVLPIGLALFWAVEFVALVPCYICGILYHSVKRHGKLLVIWIFCGPFICMFYIALGTYQFLRTCFEYPAEELMSNQTLKSHWEKALTREEFEA
jgi:hypothetical protein